jgi:hypothetical protein
MGLDGELYRMFWPLPDIDPKDIMRSRSLRMTFDGIVKKCGFWTEFEEYYRVCFMALEKED